MTAAPSLRPPRLGSLQQRLLLELSRNRALVEEAAARCPPADAAAKAMLAETRAELDTWEATVRAPPRALDATRDCDAMRRLARRRIYLLTPSELSFESLGALRHMREEGVPARVLDELSAIRDAEVLPAVTQPGSTMAVDHARAATARIVEARDVWEVHGEQHYLQTRIWAGLLSAFSISALCLASYMMFLHLLLPGFLLGGVAGSAVSIATRLPPFDTKGSTRNLTRGLLGRFSLGLAASAVGLGLLASGFITLPVGGTPLPDIIAHCTRSTVVEGCTRPSLLALLGVAILLGFSERALRSFETSVFGGEKAGGGKGKAEGAHGGGAGAAGAEPKVEE